MTIHLHHPHAPLGTSECGIQSSNFAKTTSESTCDDCKESARRLNYPGVAAFLKSLESRTPNSFPRSAINETRDRFNHQSSTVVLVDGAHLFPDADGLALGGAEAELSVPVSPPVAISVIGGAASMRGAA